MGFTDFFCIINPVQKSLNIFLITIGMVGIVVRAIICLIRSDLKILIAYSSVSHISCRLIVLMNFTGLRFSVIILIALSHGFTSFSNILYWKLGLYKK